MKRESHSFALAEAPRELIFLRAFFCLFCLSNSAAGFSQSEGIEIPPERQPICAAAPSSAADTESGFSGQAALCQAPLGKDFLSQELLHKDFPKNWDKLRLPAGQKPLSPRKNTGQKNTGQKNIGQKNTGQNPGHGAPVYSKHWYGAAPVRKGQKSLLLIHDIFAISFDLRTRFPQWTAYHLDPSLTWGGLKERRDYKLDPYLPPGAGLERKDYKGISQFSYDRGHFAPLGSFKGSRFAYQAQYLSNIVPQKRNLNQGPWRILEESIRAFVNNGRELKVLTGPLYGNSPYGANYGKTLAPWPALQGKAEQLPSGFWKMAAFRDRNRIKLCSFIMPQDVRSRKTPPKKYIVPRSQVEKHTGLVFFEGAGAAVRDDCGFLPLN